MSFGDERQYTSPGTLVKFFLTTAGDDESDYFAEMPLGSSSGREQRHMVLSNIQGLDSCARFQVPDRGLAVLCFAECGLHDRLTLIELCLVLENELAELESKTCEGHRSEG